MSLGSIYPAELVMRFITPKSKICPRAKTSRLMLDPIWISVPTCTTRSWRTTDGVDSDRPLGRVMRLAEKPRGETGGSLPKFGPSLWK